MTSMTDFVSKQWAKLPEVPIQDLSDKVIIVTGANVGLGFESTKHLARSRPKKLILACRNLEKAQKAIDTIRAQTNYDGMEAWQLDLASFDSIKAFVKKFEAAKLPLHVLLSNAGVAFDVWTTTQDGWETTLQVNHLGNMLLVLLLLPILRKTAVSAKEARLIIVASEVHFWAQFPEKSSEHILQTLNDSTKFNARDRYNVSKLLNMLMTKSLVKRLGTSKTAGDANLVVHTVTPGLCESDLGNGNTWLGQWMLWTIRKLLAKTAEQGSRTLVEAAVGESAGLGKAPQGSFWENCEPSKPSALVQSEEGVILAEKIWKESMDVLVQVAPEVAKVFGKQ